MTGWPAGGGLGDYTRETGMPDMSSNRLIYLGIALLCSGGVVAQAQNSDGVPVAQRQTVQPVQLAVAAQPIAAALNDFARQSGLHVVIGSEIAKGVRSAAVEGMFTPEAALERLLANTGLRYEYLDAQTVAVLGRERPSAEVMKMSGVRVAAGQGASATYGAEAQRDAAGDGEKGEGTKLEEIVVTAQKRVERLQDVPVPVSAISAQTLVDNNQLRLQDYYSQIPGLSFSPSIYASQLLSFRGITTGGLLTIPTVGIMLDDVPFGSTSTTFAPDIDPGDLARIEALRGPQGTLYGASSMGGLIKFVTVDPSTQGVNGRLEVGSSSVRNGAGLGYSLRGSVNVPLSDTLAVRASGYTRQDPGYIDNPVLHINGINEDHASGARLAALWRPSDTLSLKLSALYQDLKGDGSNDVTPEPWDGPSLGDLQQYYIRGMGAFDKKIQGYNAVLVDKIGSVELTAASGYNVNSLFSTFDATAFVGQALTLPLFGVSGTPVFDQHNIYKFTQEIRLSAPIGPKLDGLLGVFYTHEYGPDRIHILATDPATGAVAGEWLDENDLGNYRESAVFADLTFHITNRFDLQIGGRESQIRQTSGGGSLAGPWVTDIYGFPSSPYTPPVRRSKSNPFTYLFTPQFKVSSDLMVYARLASGYRPGGANGSPGLVPPEFQPDKTYNYEIGAKGDFLDHTLSFDASVYYIDWKGIQLGLIYVDPNTGAGVTFTSNAARAKSQGIELSVESRPIKGLTMTAWVELNDAALKEAFPSSALLAGTYGAAGDRLPYSSRFSGNLSLNEEFPLAGKWTGFVGGSINYVGGRVDIFTGSPQRQDLPAYAKTNLSTGVKYESWTANFYCTNVTDRRGLISGAEAIPYSFYYIQPRAIGLSLTRAF